MEDGRNKNKLIRRQPGRRQKSDNSNFTQLKENLESRTSIAFLSSIILLVEQAKILTHSFVSNIVLVPTRGVQAVITGSYWLQPLTANRLGGYCILPTASANRVGRGGYLYSHRLTVIDYITGGYITAFEDGF